MRILIVEEEFANRKALSRFLGRFGECDIAVDGMEATFAYIEALERKEYYDLICMDRILSVLDGSKVVYNIRTIEKEKHIPQEHKVTILLMDAECAQEQSEKALEAGCDALIHKPVDLEELQSHIGRIMEVTAEENR